ncbi:MAG TPA: ArsR family transcriptional regulator [Acidimicrobiales bacterium]|nr:ArsR family transcriptional regulator [Acidimicrobiales bacterium]
MSTLQRQARALGDPTRHEIFRYVADAERPVDIAALTAHVGHNHNAIRQHLAKLVDAGLLVEAREASGRRGRPRLLYEVAPGAGSRWGVTGPYERLSLLLAEVLRTGDSPVEVGRRAGRGRRRGDRPPAVAPSSSAVDAATEITAAMAREGFEPEAHRRGDRIDIVLHTCPYESTALADPDTVCAIHLGMAEGVAEGTDATVDRLIARDPRRGGCRLLLQVGGRGGSDLRYDC